MKKLILILIFLIATLGGRAFADEVFKVTSVNFDTSNAMVLLTSPDNTSEPLMKNIKLVKMKDPNRAYFDINSAILTTQSQNWFFNSGGLKQIKVGQFSVNPNVIRVVMYFDEDFNPDKVQFLRVNNNIIIKLKDGLCQSTYFQNTYRDERSAASDFYENLTISSQIVTKEDKVINVADKTNDKVFEQIQQAFNASNIPDIGTIYKNAEVQNLKKDLNLNTKYYLKGAYAKSSAILLSGYGSVSLEKPMYLTNPARVVFDIPNALVNQEIRNKEFKLNETDTAKVGQFEYNKARIVITTNDVQKYIPIYSADNQTLLIANTEKMDVGSLFSNTSDAVSYYAKKVDSRTSDFIIAFNRPVVHAIKRDTTQLSLYLLNVGRYNDNSFKNAIKNTPLSDVKVSLLPKIGLKITIPLEKNSVVNCFLGSDAKSIQVRVKDPSQPVSKPAVAMPEPVNPVTRVKRTGTIVVIDPGHGGGDYGAIRAGINEKDINLDVSKRVEAILKSRGYKVEMTREVDEAVSLQGRVDICENVGGDVFVSIHVNSNTRTEPTGVETHYYHDYSINLAQTVHAKMASYVKSNDRGLIKSRFYVINHTTVPAILVEIGFISNDDERAQLVSEQRKQATAKAIAEGIMEYLNANK